MQLMKAIIVPGLTDLNKGDQALVWESWRLIKDTALYEKIFILSDYDCPLVNEQSKRMGFDFIKSILKHPRRNKQHSHNYIKESLFDVLRMTSNAIFDFISMSLLLLVCNNLKIVKFLFPGNIYESIVLLKNIDTFYVKGGGFIHAYGEKKAPYLIWYFLFYVRLAYKLKKQIIVLPNSFGPFEGFGVKKQIKNVLDKVDFIYAREHESANSLGCLLNKPIKVRSDLGFFLKSADNNKAIEILNRYQLTQNDKIIGLTVRPWRFPGSQNSSELYQNYVNTIQSFIEHVVKLNFKVVLCNQSLGLGAHEDDRNSIKDILRKQYDKNSVIWLNEDLSCDLLKAIYSNFYLFVGTRFHSVIFAITSFVPSIAIGYGGNKANGIMSDYHLDKYMISINNINDQRLIEAFNELLKNYNYIKKTLCLNYEKITVDRVVMIEEIKKIIKSKNETFPSNHNS